MLGSDFEGVMRHLDAVLAFGAFQHPLDGVIDDLSE